MFINSDWSIPIDKPAKAAIKNEVSLANSAAARAGTIKKLAALTSNRVAGPARIIKNPHDIEARIQLIAPIFLDEIPNR